MSTMGGWVMDGLHRSFLYSENLALGYLEMPYGEIFLFSTFKRMSLCLHEAWFYIFIYWWAFQCQSINIKIWNDKRFSLKHNDLVWYIISLLFFQEKLWKVHLRGRSLNPTFFFWWLQMIKCCPVVMAGYNKQFGLENWQSQWSFI